MRERDCRLRLSIGSGVTIIILEKPSPSLPLKGSFWVGMETSLPLSSSLPVMLMASEAVKLYFHRYEEERERREGDGGMRPLLACTYKPLCTHRETSVDFG